MTHTLRDGFTTGTATAAAAKAAVTTLLSGKHLQEVVVALPPLPANDDVPDRYLTIPIETIRSTPISRYTASGPIASASVIKDGGDDPDATHGMQIIVHASKTPFIPAASSPSQHVITVCQQGITTLMYGGEGIGTATLPGLPVAVGEPAINPHPRQQIAYAVAEAAHDAHAAQPLHIMIEAPDGAQRAIHTLNARLGILGGISILGTQGTVRPFSHDAWQATITHGLNIATATDRDTILFSTGRRSERLLMGLYPHLPETAFIQAADFAAFSIQEATRHSIRHIIWGCFAGKLLKLAQNLEYTHARSGAADLELFASLCSSAGGHADLCRALATFPTATGAFAHLESTNAALATNVYHALANKAYTHIVTWSNMVRESDQLAPAITLHVFSHAEQRILSIDKCIH